MVLPPALRASRVAGAAALATLLAFAFACAHPLRPPSSASEQVGLASYYSPTLAGRRTASGERYDPRALTAAHRTLAFGSIVRVERLAADGRASGGHVDVRINDRGPFVRGRIIDLSEAAAHALRMKDVGVARVRVRVVALPQ